jgi:hypothetical protein
MSVAEWFRGEADLAGLEHLFGIDERESLPEGVYVFEGEMWSRAFREGEDDVRYDGGFRVDHMEKLTNEQAVKMAVSHGCRVGSVDTIDMLRCEALSPVGMLAAYLCRFGMREIPGVGRAATDDERDRAMQALFDLRDTLNVILWAGSVESNG